MSDLDCDSGLEYERLTLGGESVCSGIIATCDLVCSSSRCRGEIGAGDVFARGDVSVDSEPGSGRG